MGALTEVEIFDCLSENYRLAAQHCDDLAVSPRKGPIYKQFRDEIKLVIGAARQAATWREDCRWLKCADEAAHAHKLAGGWLRGVGKDKNGLPIKFAQSEIKTLFTMLAAKLRQMQRIAEEFRTKATGRTGMILPIEQAPPTRTQGRSVSVMLPPGMMATKSGLIVPRDTVLH